MSDFVWGLLFVILAGILAGGSSAPIKWMRFFRYEHWALISVLIGMLILPWSILLCSADIKTVMANIPVAALVKANLFSLAWGVANVLAGLCLLRIGFSLSVGILTGVGLPIGVLIPMICRGSGMFADAPTLFSRAGLFIVPGVIIMLGALVLITRAGFGKETGAEREERRPNGGFKTGLVMATTAGVLQVGLSFAFIYSQGPINEALRAAHAGTAGMLVGVWAFTLPGGLLVNLGYILWRLYRHRNWRRFMIAPREVALSVLIGIAFLGFVASLGIGMQMMGALGASIGFGIYQTMQVASSQAVGFISGEWHQAPAKNLRQMRLALFLLLIAVVCFSAGKV